MKGLGILCPGQGNQHPAMFDALLGSAAAENALLAAAPAFGGHPVEYLRSLSAESLFHNQAAQLLIATLQMATWAALRHMLPEPNVFAGYSMGEVAAYGCAGALELPEALELIGRRATIMDEVSPSDAGLLAVRGLNRDEMELLCRFAGVDIAIINTPDHFVVGGSAESLAACQHHPVAGKASTLKRLQVDVPSHTSCLQEASQRFAAELEVSSLQPPAPPVLAGVSGAVIRTREQAIAALAQQISHTINWMACMRSVVEMGCQVVLELGPGNALAKMMKELYPEIIVRSVEDFRSLQGVASWVEKQCS